MFKRSLLFLVLLLALSACGPQQVNFSSGQVLPQLTVQGEARVEVPPDQLQLRLGVVTQEEDADAALAENSRRMQVVMGLLQQLGIAAEELATDQFRIIPQWSQPPRPTPANWQRTIVGYRVSNELQIKTARIDLAGSLLALAQQAGANQVGGLNFGLMDPEKQRLLAIEQATVRAMDKAQRMAKAAGVELGELLSFNLGVEPPQPRLMAEMRMASAETVPVASGLVEVSASVSMTYRLLEPAAQPQP